MTDQVRISRNGHLVVCIPLFRVADKEALDTHFEYTICAIKSKPIAYAIDSYVGCHVASVEAVENNLELLGEL